VVLVAGGGARERSTASSSVETSGWVCPQRIKPVATLLTGVITISRNNTDRRVGGPVCCKKRSINQMYWFSGGCVA